MKQDDKGVHFFTHFSYLFVPVLRGDTEQWVFGCFSSLELIIATRETCDKLQEECGDNPHVHFMPLEMDRLYLFTNVRLNNGDDRKRTVVKGSGTTFQKRGSPFPRFATTTGCCLL